MGASGFSISHLLVVLVVVLLVFGTSRLRTLGSDLGEAVKGFRNAMSEGERGKDADTGAQRPVEKVVGGEERPRDKT